MSRDVALTIGIPTCGGAASLPATLESVLSQAPDGVEVLISDNASSDATPEIVRGFQRRAPGLKYFRNKTNVGFDRNVDAVVRRAAGRFVWLFCDDDLMRPGAVARVLDVIAAKPDVCEIYVDALRPYTDLDQDVLCAGGDEFLRRTAFRFGGLSSNVVNKAAWRAADLAPALGSGWVHAAFVLASVGRAPTYVCRESLKFENPDFSRKRWGGGGDFLRVAFRWAEVARRAMRAGGYSPKALRAALRAQEAGFLVAIPKAKAQGLRTDLDLVRDGIRLFGNLPSFWLVDLPLLLIPAALYRLGYKLYRLEAVRDFYRRHRAKLGFE